MAPGASLVLSITSLTRESRWPVITMTRSGSVLPRLIATTSITSVGLGVRLPVNTCEGVTTSMQPPQSFEIASKRDFTQRRAAPMPRVSDFVSDSVWRVPKPTRRVIVMRSSTWLGASASACNDGCSRGTAGRLVAATAGTQASASRAHGRIRRRIGGFLGGENPTIQPLRRCVPQKKAHPLPGGPEASSGASIVRCASLRNGWPLTAYGV